MIKALAIVGPTASGKTALSLDVAKRLGCEIISCDSMQIYRGMDIGTAKATAEEQARVPHHLIDFLDAGEDFSVDSYRELALKTAEELSSRGKIPLFVGGTGLYIDSLMRADAQNVPKSSDAYVKEQMKLLEAEGGADILHARLMEVDPESAEKIHKNNTRRLIRALEIYDKTGIPKSVLDRQTQAAEPPIDIKMITLDFHARETLYARIDMRVDKMMSEGLYEEVERLYSSGAFDGGKTASQAIGYKELFECIKGNISLSEAAEAIKQSSRRYAKRQLTWFRHEKCAHTLYVDDESGKMRSYEDILREALEFFGRTE